MSRAPRKQRAAPLRGDAVSEDVTANENEVWLSSLATQKFHYEDIVNADPLCPPSALKIVRAHLNFVTNFEVPVYVPTIKLMARTNLSTRTITDSRRLLVKLGYFELAGKTAKGAQLYLLKLPRESLVLDHIDATAQTYRERDIERKAQQRKHRAEAKANEEVTAGDTVIEETTSPVGERSPDDVTAETTSPKGEDVSENLKPVIVQTKSESLDDSLEEYGSEEEIAHAQKRDPPSRDEVDELVEQFGDPGHAVVGFWRKLNSEGRFSYEVVIGYWAAVNARTDPVVEGLKRAARFFG